MTVSPRCTHCGQPAQVPALAHGYEDRGNITDYLWLCGVHRTQTQAVLGVPSSPGRPPKPPSATARARALWHSAGHRRSSQTPSVAAPRPWTPTPPKPESPTMPQPGPWS